MSVESSVKKRVALFGGSFNPVHIGHTMLADYLVAYGGFDEVWMSLAAINPLKGRTAPPPGTPSDSQRLDMLKIALDGSAFIRPCDVELTLPRPSYSITTLRYLAEMHPDCSFVPVIGADNWLIFERWRAYQSILSEFGVAVYPRPGYEVDPNTMPEQARWIEAPTFEVSSTFIREAIGQGRYMDFFLPAGVYDYILANKLYVTE